MVVVASRIETGRRPPAALAHDDRAAGDEVAVVRLDAQPLGVDAPLRELP
jgi:hypothetical protein